MNNYADDADIRGNPDLLGRDAYEASLKAYPRYTMNGEPRPTWDQLDEAQRWSWSLPTQRP